MPMARQVSPTESPSAESARVACTSCVSAGLASLFYINALLSTTVPSGHAGASRAQVLVALSQFRTQEHHVACVDCRLDGRSAIGIEAAPTTSNHSAGKCEIRSSDRVLAATARDRWHGKGDAGMSICPVGVDQVAARVRAGAAPRRQPSAAAGGRQEPGPGPRAVWWGRGRARAVAGVGGILRWSREVGGQQGRRSRSLT